MPRLPTGFHVISDRCMSEQVKTVVVICGATATGKTDVAIRLASRYDTAIISADSRQCFRELDIGVARPSAEQLAAVPHYFVADRPVTESVTAADFEKFALEAAQRLFETRDVVIVAGGTGLYIQAFVSGLDAIPAIPAATRAQVISRYESEGISWLQSAVREKDPAFFAQGEIQNPQRLMRALEVIESTGRSILSFRKGQTQQRPFRFIKLGLDVPRPELNARIDRRVDEMMRRGLLEEAKRLLPFRTLNALQTVGYAELFDHFDGKTGLDTAVNLIRQHTRQYAKRQVTWFKKDKDLHWIAAGDHAAIDEWVDGQIKALRS
jgi:tRNA dimethylallyltransferase